jgi:uncharacterized BrkB/YihY/UPF0761 family membrane protein
VNSIQRTVRRVDAFQQRHALPSFLFGVVKKFGDDSAGSLAALIAYYGFLSLFPLLLVLTTLLGIFFAHDAALDHRILHSAVGQFPIVGPQLTGPNGVGSLRSGSTIGLIVGLLGLVWGSFGVSQAAQRAMALVWNIPKVARPGFVARLGRNVAFLALLGLDLVLTTFLAGLVTIGHGPLWLQVPAGLLLPGAAVAGVGWTILQYAGTALVGHALRHASQLYGFFGSVLGLISFLYLSAELAVYAAEVNVVRARQLYPRSMAPPPLTRADEAVLSAMAQQGQRRPEERVDVDFPPIDEES